MRNDSQLSITVMSNKPSDQALRNFQRKLYQLQQSNELNKLIRPAYDNKAYEPK